MWSGAKILDALLALEANQTKSKWAIALAIIPLAYYALHLLVIDTSYEMKVAISMDAVAVFTLYSLVWLQPLHIALGKDLCWPATTTVDSNSIDSQQQQRQSSHPLHLLNVGYDHLFNDSTLRVVAWTTVFAFLCMVGGDTGFFVHLGWFHEGQESPPIWGAVIYVLGSFSANIALGLGAAYVALTHNLIAAQLQTLAHHLESGLSSASSSLMHNVEDGLTTYGTSSDDVDGRALIANGESVTMIDASWLAHQHAEFRRRQDTLARVFHRRVFVAMLAFSIEVTLSVTAGFEEQRMEFTSFELTAMIVMFFGNAYSLWTIAFTMGRVPFVSREETAFAAQKRALLAPDPSFVNIANTMTHFPITFHIGPFEWSSEISKAFTFFILSLVGVFVGVHIPEFE